MGFPGYKTVFRLNDQDGDGALDKQELRDFLVKLAGEDKPTSVDLLKKRIYDDLNSHVIDNYTAPVNVYSGDDAGREQWIKLCINDFIETHWEKYEIRKEGLAGNESGDIDEIKSYNLISQLAPKILIDYAGYKAVFKLHDQDDDGSLDKKEMAEFM